MDSIHIVKYTVNDFNSYFKLVKEDEVMKYISGKGLTEAEAKKKFESILKLNEDLNLGYFKIYENNFHVGDCKLVNYRKDERVFEVGYILKKEYWGKGLGTKICRKLVDLANEINPQKSIIGIIDPQNMASRKLLEKLGFQSYFMGIEDGLATEKLILKKL